MRYKFTINKEVNFTYWLQASTDWIWYFNPKESEFYQSLTGEFNDQENQELKKFARFLRPPKIYSIIPDFRKRGYVWLWNRYAEMPIKNYRQEKYWRQVKLIFTPKFDILWSKHHPHLEFWRKKLEKQDFSSVNQIIKRAEIFFGSKFEEEIKIQLCLSYDKNPCSGHVKRGYKNLIILNISNFDHKNIYKVFDTLTHETIHLVFYDSNKNDLLNQAYKNIIKPIGISQKNPSWKHLFIESIVTSMAGKNFSYFNQYLNNKGVNLSSAPVWGATTNQQIIKVAYELRDITNRYLEEGREMDQNYADNMAKIWLRFKTEKS